ncbi:alpha/beta hydrolase [Rhizobium sp. CECT 9324]|uniref:alpha/beta fold hydrolase n=1 Tax=Rhizobium sp. CECT 9324 TaxID=2845820 RepID=UPI001E31EA56|nr:alpha/beta hydrolase [Rhizobium sp. CECT 9324]CAH0340136.1 Esterase YbfF [Rhizobium sp. CECT 9324]
MPDPVTNGIEDRFISVPDGLKLHVRVHGRENSGLPVVCLPGLTRNGRDFEAIARLLSSAPHDCKVISITSRGRGLSDRDPEPTRYTIPVEAMDVVAVLDQLAIERAHFIGTSRGGLILHVLAMTHLDRIASVVLNDIGPVLEIEGLRQIQAYLGRRRKPQTFAEAALILKEAHGDEFPALSDEDWQGLASAIYRETDGEIVTDYDPEIGIQFRAADFNQPLADLWPQFALLADLPVMVIRGEHSRLLSSETVDLMSERHPRLLAVTASGQGHAPLLDLGPLPEQIAGFLNKSI